MTHKQKQQVGRYLKLLLGPLPLSLKNVHRSLKDRFQARLRCGNETRGHTQKRLMRHSQGGLCSVGAWLGPQTLQFFAKRL